MLQHSTGWHSLSAHSWAGRNEAAVEWSSGFAWPHNFLMTSREVCQWRSVYKCAVDDHGDHGCIDGPVMPRRRTDGDLPLPGGWEECVDSDGKPFFLNHHSQQSTWVDPRDRWDWAPRCCEIFVLVCLSNTSNNAMTPQKLHCIHCSDRRPGHCVRWLR